MRFVNFLITISTVFIAVQSPSAWSMPTESTLQGPYLGLPTPEDTPVLFGPGLISTQHYSYGGTFSPDMRSFYFLRKPNAETKVEFVVFQQQGETWIESIFDSRTGQPLFSPDGKVMHLGKRIKNASTRRMDESS
ncbi:hypothetical protein [Lacimicrobium sp. SS2-24]|uniref:hypothetical protein n=1 Tax=Lacimicrobium sp. SS2-24 TaxID=2005569 RepID=UPI000B4B36D5|nr:hypothetical protein [Lacimicrobium sp. SS2-24]